MQELRELSRAVDAIHQEMADTFMGYQQRRTLFCRNGCGKCCLHPEIHATPLEMLPLAISLYDKGEAETVLAALESNTNETGRCRFYHMTSDANQQGFCSVYQYRPAICRMFGAAGYPDKYGQPGLSTCQPIKEDHPQALAATLISLKDESPPMIRDWKSRVTNLDYELGKEDMPINQAARQALVKVLMAAQYGDAED